MELCTCLHGYMYLVCPDSNYMYIHIHTYIPFCTFGDADNPYGTYVQQEQLKTGAQDIYPLDDSI